ncbi:MAG TPA: helicase C-terminal domain-containing protein, partial [Ktedonobacteraceae bacterium]|nr:helicase C-terminal domain-containing protein [Ktedonobacteraceae bacterium]
AARPWEKVAQVATSSELVKTYVKQLRQQLSRGPFVFANRYDGIDLPGDSCRFLIMDGLPYGLHEYEVHRASIFTDSAAINNELMQRIEQGIGRAARGTADYCVVILTGKELVSRLTMHANQQLLTSSTRAQLEIGLAVSKDVASKEALKETIMSCLRRDEDWIAFHADSLASLISSNQVDILQLELAALERRAFRLMRDGYFEKAMTQLEKYSESTPALDPKSKGWLLQFAAAIAQCWGHKDEAQRLQRHAYAQNNNLLRPQVAPPYVPLPVPSKQAEAIVERIDHYTPRRGYMAEFERVVSHLVSTASAPQFEQALADLGSMLGFRSERPEKNYKIGPDVLWLLTGYQGMVMEVKSQKESDKALTKEEHGQLLNAETWFKQAYPSYTCIRVSVHPNVLITKSVKAGESKVLTLDELRQLVVELRRLLEVLTGSQVSRSDLILQCERLLASSTLEPQSLIQRYLQRFREES